MNLTLSCLLFHRLFGYSKLPVGVVYETVCLILFLYVIPQKKQYNEDGWMDYQIQAS